MAISLDDDAVLLDSGIRMKFLRDAEYSPAPPLVGISSGEQTLLQCTPDGKLVVLADLAIPSIYPEVDMRARDATDVAQYLQVDVDPVTSRYALLTNDPRMSFSGGALEVSFVQAVETGSINKYDSASTLDGVWVTVVSQTVLTGQSFDVSGFHVWSNVDAQWSLEYGATVLGGTRTSPSNVAGNVSYSKAVVVSGPATVVIKAKHGYAGQTITMNANLEGRLH